METVLFLFTPESEAIPSCGFLPDELDFIAEVLLDVEDNLNGDLELELPALEKKKMMNSPSRRHCKVEGCTRIKRSRGLCRQHGGGNSVKTHFVINPRVPRPSFVPPMVDCRNVEWKIATTWLRAKACVDAMAGVRCAACLAVTKALNWGAIVVCTEA